MRQVTITGGMREFVGQTGQVVAKEGKLYRVRLDYPVTVPGVGEVHDDLWEGRFLKTRRQPKPIRFQTAYGWAGGGSR